MDNTEEQDQTTSIGEGADTASSRPAATFSGTGGITVAVWKHKSDNGLDNFSVRIERNYKDNEGKFKSTAYLRDGDLLRVQKLLSQADDWVEQEKTRVRSANSVRNR